MKRTDVIQKIIDKKKARNYLEIGVATGDNFFPIKAKNKTAVDPAFNFAKGVKNKWILKNLCNFAAKYHETTSEEFFAGESNGKSYDVAFIDGMHTYEQTLRDVLNTLSRLNDNGVIVIHDCNPKTAAEAHPADSYKHAASLNLPGWSGGWSGDVWKTICFLRSQRKDLKIFVLNCDHGLGIVMKGSPDACLDLSSEQVDRMSYEDLASDRDGLLNLKDKSYLSEFLKTI